jgi:ankyrin repeat protein
VGQASVDAAAFEALLTQCRPAQSGAAMVNHTFKPPHHHQPTEPGIVVTAPLEREESGDDQQDKAKAEKRGWSLLHEAVEMNRVDLASLLIKKGANVNITDDRFASLIFSPASRLATLTVQLFSLSLCVCVCVCVCVRSCVYIERRGFSPLHLAALHNRKESLALLLSADADVTLQSHR